MGELSYWISGAALFLSVIVALTGYLQKPTFISMARATEMRAEISDLTAQIAGFEARIKFLEGRCQALMEEREYWLGQYRELERRTRTA